MKQVTAIFAILIFSLSCDTNKQISAGGSQIGLRNLNHYYLKNSVALNSSYNGIVISDADHFNNLFYFDDYTKESGSVPDFSGQVVVALALNTLEDNRINFTKAEIKGSSINVYGKLKTERDNTESTPVAIATLPRYLSAKDVNFYIDGNLVQTVHLLQKTKNNIFAEAEGKDIKQSHKPVRKKPSVV